MFNGHRHVRTTFDLGPREQLNEVTSFLDASAIYGSTGERADSLRSHADGKQFVSMQIYPFVLKNGNNFVLSFSFIRYCSFFCQAN